METLTDLKIELVLSKAQELKTLNLFFRETSQKSQIYINNKLLRPLKERLMKLENFSFSMTSSSMR